MNIFKKHSKNLLNIFSIYKKHSVSVMYFSFLLLSFYLYSQNQNSFSELINEGRVLFSESNYESALKIFENANCIAKILDNSNNIAESAYYKALCYEKLKQIDESKKFINEALYELDEKDNDILASVLLLKGKIEKDNNEFISAKNNAEKVLSLKNISDDTIIRTHLFIIEIYLLEKDKDNVKRYITKLNKYIPKTNNSSLKGWYYNLQGDYYSIISDNENAGRSYLMMLIEYKKINSASKIAYSLSLAANSFLAAKNYKKAVNLFYRSARCHYSAKNQEKGKLNLNEALKLINYASYDLKERINILSSEE